MLRYLDCFYRHRRLLIAMLALPVVVSLLMVSRQARTFEATARVWVDTTIEGEQVNYYATPAEVGSQILNELLRTRAFGTKVGRASGLAADLTPKGRTGGPALDELVYQTLSLQASAATGGPNVVNVSFLYRDPRVAARTALALVDAFRQEVLGGRVERDRATVSFYDDQVNKARADLAAADAKVSNYLATSASGSDALFPSGALTAFPPVDATATADQLDPALQALKREDDAARARSEDLTKKFDQARLDLTIAQQSAPSAVRLIDRPLPPGGPVSRAKSLLAAGLGGITAGILLALLALTALTAADSSIRYAPEVEPALGLRLVGSVPRI